MSDIQATPAEQPPEAAAVAVTAAPADQGNVPASDASATATSTTDSASPVSASTSEPAATSDAPSAPDPTPVDVPTPVEPEAPAAPAVPASTPPAPAISDAQMASAASVLETLAAMYSGMTFAMSALRQIGSMGTAILARQQTLDELSAQLAQTQVQLTAVQGDVTAHTEGANSIVANAVTYANKLRQDADSYVAMVRAQAVKDAAVLREGAVAECDAMRAAADTHVSTAHADVAQAHTDVGAIHALKTVLQGELSDLETKVAVGRASLRHLLGEAK
jgi:hypothetical protein